MAYISSNSISIYPSVARGAIDPEAKLTTEKNLTQSLKSFIRDNFQGFVISGSAVGDAIEFCLGGYYFSVNGASLQNLIESGSELWANIKVAKTYGTQSPKNYQSLLLYPSAQQELLDTNNEFQGVNFTTSKDSNADYSLKLFNSEGVVPEDSKLWWKDSQLEHTFNHIELTVTERAQTDRVTLEISQDDNYNPITSR